MSLIARRASRPLLLALIAGTLSAPLAAQQPGRDAGRTRARDLGVEPGIFPTGTNNAITDVAGVRVGQVTINEGDSVRTGVTAIMPHPGNAYLERVPAAIFVGNGFGKLLGVTQVRELGELETPILLTCTLCVWKAADAMAAWMLEQPGMEQIRSINPVVGETNDGGLNDIRARPVTAEQVREALTTASDGAVREGSVGAGSGNERVRVEGRDRHVVPRLARGARRVPRGCAGSEQLRGHSDSDGRAGG